MALNSVSMRKGKLTQDYGDYFYWAYANMQMLIFAINNGKPRYDRECFMLRAKAFKAYKDGRWVINDLYDNNRWKLQEDDCICWYCGKEVSSRSELTADHMFPRAKGGDSSFDNLVMVCKSCNSSKGKLDLLEWFFEKRDEFPPPHVFAHYYKLIYKYAKEHDLLGKHREEMEAMDLPFNFKYIVLNFPPPDFFFDFDDETGNSSDDKDLEDN